MFAYFSRVPERGTRSSMGNSPPLIAAPLPDQESKLNLNSSAQKQLLSVDNSPRISSLLFRSVQSGEELIVGRRIREVLTEARKSAGA